MFPNVYTCPLINTITSTVHTLFLSAAAVLYSSLLRYGSDNSVEIIFRFKSLTPKMLFHMIKQPVIIWDEIWKVGWMCQHLPEPTLNLILHITMAMKCCTVLEQNDTMFKQCWLFTANTQAHLILQECAVIWATDCRR